MAYPFEKRNLSKIVISTAFGHYGDGILFYKFWPAYKHLLEAAKKTKTTIFAKSSTRLKRIGNFIEWNPSTYKYIQRLSNMGMVNAYGLTNSGIEASSKKIGKSIGKGFRIIPNFYPEFANDAEKAIKDTLDAMQIFRKELSYGFSAIEMNYSCPNSKEKISENMHQIIRCEKSLQKNFPTIFRVAKISYLHPYELSQELEKIGTGAIHAVNSIPFSTVFPGKISPINNVQGGGGVSGGPAFSMAFGYNQELRKKVKLPLIMGCGVVGLFYIQKYFDIGADSVSICTLAIRDPKEAERIIIMFNGKI